jgi:NTP pyrophosphatase (non-canonical NTP hydrolase)
MTFSNQLSCAEIERLALLAEEMGEALHAIGKILRHGYESVDPTIPADKQISNRMMLERELGDVRAAIIMLCLSEDVSKMLIHACADKKLESVRKWLHHQT